MKPALAPAAAAARPRDPLASFLEVTRDVGAMKRMSIPIVAELGSYLRRRPAPDILASALEVQLADEHRHVALCEAMLAGREGRSPLPAPRYVGAFARAVTLFAAGAARPYVLWVATILCTAVEAVALAQLAREAPDPRWRQLFEELSRDEAGHFRLVSGPVAERLARIQAPRSPLRAQGLVLALAAISFGWWWPARLAAYRSVGLDVNKFVQGLGDELTPVLARVGVFFPRRLFVWVAGAWLRMWGRSPGRRAPRTMMSHDHE